MEGQVTEQEKMFKKYLFMTSNKGLLSKIHKGLLKLNSKETNTLVVKWEKDLNKHLIREDIQII